MTLPGWDASYKPEEVKELIAKYKAQDMIKIEYATITDSGISCVTVFATLGYRGNFVDGTE